MTGVQTCALPIPYLHHSLRRASGGSSSSGDKYHTARRHTVGPGDTAHEQVLDSHYILPHYKMENLHAAQPFGILPNTNLLLNLPLVKNQPPQNFSVKDQHLLKPPPVMGAMGGFGRRASDGGANFQMYFENWSQPGSHEQIQLVPAECSPPHSQGSQPLTTSVSTISGSGEISLSGGTGVLPTSMSAGVPSGHLQLSDATSMEDLPHDNCAISKYLQNRGSSKRHTLAMVSPEEVQEAQRKMHLMQHQQPPPPPQQSSQAPMRTRRTGLHAVMERPVISPELIMEVEARMNRAHVPSTLVKSATPLVPNRAKAFHHARAKKAPSGLATVQEGSRIGKSFYNLIEFCFMNTGFSASVD